MIASGKRTTDVTGFAVQYLESATGIQVPEYRREVVQKALHDLGKGDPVDGLNRLVAGEESATTEVLELIAISETYFFRHPGHFVALRDRARRAKEAGRSFHVLSAGCSSGEEAWSAAAVLASVYHPQATYSVTGWDLCPTRLKAAAAGNYRPWSFRQGFFGLEHHFTRSGETFSVHSSLRPFVSFRPVNFMQALPLSRSFDAIFFRNVSIYWTRQQANDIAHMLASRLAPGGIFLTGPSDPIRFEPDEWRCYTVDKVCIYERNAPGSPPSAEKPSRIAAAPCTPEQLNPDIAKAPAAIPIAPTRIIDESDVIDRVKELSDQGSVVEALALLTAIPSAKTPERRYWEGILVFSLGRAEEAAKLFQQCVFLEPGQAQYRRWLAIALDATGQAAAAARERVNADRLEEHRA